MDGDSTNRRKLQDKGFYRDGVSNIIEVILSSRRHSDNRGLSIKLHIIDFNSNTNVHNAMNVTKLN